MQELADGIEKCKELAQDQLDQIVSMCSTIHEKFRQQASKNNLECFKYLNQLQKCNSYVKACTSLSAEDTTRPNRVPPIDSSNTVEHNLQDESSDAAAADGALLRAEIPPHHENKDKVEIQTAVMLPQFRHVDMNRSNSLLTVSPSGQCSLYKFTDNTYRHIALSALSDDGLRMLEQADYVVLSHDNELVVPGEFKMMFNKEPHSFYGRPYNRVKLMQGDWCVCTNQMRDTIQCELFTVNPKEPTSQGCRVIYSTSLQSNILVREYNIHVLF